MTSEGRVVQIRRLTLYWAAFFFSAVCGTELAIAQETNLSMHGFLQGNYSLNLSSPNPDNGDFKWAEERFQSKLNASKAAFRLFVKADAFYDHLHNAAALE